MRTVIVEVDTPCDDQVARMAQAVEQMLLRHSSRMRPLKFSTMPFYIGLPGAM